MCRFVAYLSQQPIILSSLVDKPVNSLVNQSRQAREAKLGLNADGVGIAWYNHAIDTLPGVYKSIQPAWNDQNLQHITSKIQSTCFLGHVRASTVGDVNLYNCHPFTHKQFSFVHNGTIREFGQIKRALLHALSDGSFSLIKGQTDSEHFFALLMDTLYKKNIFSQQQPTLTQMKQAVCSTIKYINKLIHKIAFSRLNTVLTDGKQLLATRYVSTMDQESLSLYYCTHYHPNGGAYIIVASEPLTDYHEAWSEVPENHLLIINEQLQIELTPLEGII